METKLEEVDLKFAPKPRATLGLVQVPGDIVLDMEA